MLKVYGSRTCPECTECKNALNNAGVSYEYVDICESMRNLKEFLVLRDTNDAFAPIRGKMTAGVPAFIKEDGSVTLDWQGWFKENHLELNTKAASDDCGDGGIC